MLFRPLPRDRVAEPAERDRLHDSGQPAALGQEIPVELPQLVRIDPFRLHTHLPSDPSLAGKAQRAVDLGVTFVKGLGDHLALLALPYARAQE